MKGTKVLIKKMKLIYSWDNIEKIKYAFNKISYINKRGRKKVH